MREPHRGRGKSPLAILAAVAVFALCATLGKPAQAQVPGGIQASAGGPYAGQVGVPILFTGSVLSSFGFGVTQFQWSFGDGAAGFGQNTSHAYAAPGTYYVTLTAIDPSGLTSTDYTTANVYGGSPIPPISPISVSAGGPYTGTPGQLLTFIGTVTSGPYTPYQYTYTWNFGDGFTGSGQTTAHAYSSPGTYNVTLTVLTSTGQSGSATTSASIQQALFVSAGTSTSGTVGVPVNFGATVRGGVNPTVSWTFGDGTGGSGLFVTHVYNNTGSFTVTARATDSTGAQASDAITATIGQALTVDAAGPYFGTAGQPISVYSTVSGAKQPQYRWDFGDGTSGTGANTTHVYQNAGTYTITLYVTDSATNQSASDTARAQIKASGPVVSYPAGWNIVAGPAGTVFSEADSPLYTIQPNDTTYQVFPPEAPVKSGVGYWAYFSAPDTATLSGTSSSSISVTAPAGQYIMIGNPSSTGAVTIMGADSAVSWDPQTNNWKSVSSLAPGAGAWVVVNNGGTVTLSP
jgi:PKD repeat protein